jgi:hypothetical protein
LFPIKIIIAKELVRGLVLKFHETSTGEGK